MDDQSTEKLSQASQKHSKPPRSTNSRKKSCRKCVKSKLRCDLAKPKCDRCAARGNVCEYPVDQPGRPNTSIGGCEPRLSVPLSVPLQSGGFQDDAFSNTHPSARSQHTADSRRPAQTSVPQLRFSLSSVPGSDLVPMLAADEIRDRWLRPYISASTGQQPKQLNPHTVQYLTCVLKSYLRNFTISMSPPFVHQFQSTHSPSPVLSYCCANIRTWLGKSAEYEVLILGTIKKEMEKIETQISFDSDYEILCAFQAYLLYAMALHLFPMTNSAEDALPSDCDLVIKMQEIAFKSAQAGLLSRAEESNTRPAWESWILASSKRRTLFVMYIFTNVYNSDMGLPNFVAEEIRGVTAPESKVLWEARDRTEWEKQYNLHLSKWPDGMLQISELWKSNETGTATRRERIERWLQYADEFGIMLFSTCAHIHGC